jgi:hypothetical protein
MPFRYVSLFLRRLSAHRILTLRLRITPTAELSGLGMTDIEGTSILKRIQRMVKSLDKDAEDAQKLSNLALRGEVKKLDALVQGQKDVLRKLSGEVAYGSSNSGTPSVPVQFDLTASQSTDGSTDSFMLWTAMRRNYAYGPSESTGTVSDMGNDAITPRSFASSTTPTPPSTLGRLHFDQHHPPRIGTSRLSPEEGSFDEITHRLAHILEQQQALASMLHASPAQPQLHSDPVMQSGSGVGAGAVEASVELATFQHL